MARTKGTGQLFDQVQHALNGDKREKECVASPVPGETLILDSGPQLTIETIGDFAAKVRTALAERTAVAVSFQADVELDITALQLFCSACKMAGSVGKSFTFHGPLPETLHRLVAESGVELHDKCSIDSTTCFRKIGGSTPCPN